MTTETLIATLAPHELSLASIAPEPPAMEAVPRIRPAGGPYMRFLKPLLDRALALLGLVALSPALLVVAVVVRLDSPGGVLYRQVRVGRDRRLRDGLAYPGPNRRYRNQGGEPFAIVKFRTMLLNAEAATGPVWAQGPSDPRVTRLGRFLRASHIDELPQLANVVNGHMSLVGPRPERPEFFVGLAAEVPNYAARTQVRPGITGLAQVVHKYDASLDDVRRKVEFDMRYIDVAGWQTDFAILVGTVQRCWRELREAAGWGPSDMPRVVPSTLR